MRTLRNKYDAAEQTPGLHRFNVADLEPALTRCCSGFLRVLEREDWSIISMLCTSLHSELSKTITEQSRAIRVRLSSSDVSPGFASHIIPVNYKLSRTTGCIWSKLPCPPLVHWLSYLDVSFHSKISIAWGNSQFYVNKNIITLLLDTHEIMCADNLYKK